MKKLFFIVLGVGIILILSQPSFAQYELSFTGNSFNSPNNAQSIDKHYTGWVSTYGQLHCQLNFPHWVSGYNVSRISATYYDNSLSYLGVGLYKVDRWSGSSTYVCYMTSEGAVDGIRYMNLPKSQMTAYGLDNNRYAWYIYAYSGSETNIRLHSVTVRWEYP